MSACCQTLDFFPKKTSSETSLPLGRQCKNITLFFAYLIKLSAWIKGNKMGFAGLKKEKDRASVILYLNQNSDNPKSLP